jgi:hypothetical protein
MRASMDRRRGMTALPAQGTVCKILNKQEVKPHKVRYYLERRDAEFENKMAERLPRGCNPEAGHCRAEKANQGSGDRLL